MLLATAAVVAAVAGAAVFFGANPLADAAVPAAELFLAAKTAELTVLETALLVAAAGAAALGAVQITYTPSSLERRQRAYRHSPQQLCLVMVWKWLPLMLEHRHISETCLVHMA